MSKVPSVLSVGAVDGYSIKIYRDFEDVLSRGGEIRNLGNRADWKNAYFSIPWLCAWLKRQPKDAVRPLLLLAENAEGDLIGFWPFVERPGILGSRILWPFVSDEANYFHPICTRKGGLALVEGMHKLLKYFQLCWIPLMTDSFWLECMETEVQNSKLLSLVRSPRKTAKIICSEKIDFDEFWSNKMGGKSRKSFRYDQRALEANGSVKFESFESFDEVREVMPATCVVEVESWKSKERAGLYSIRGKRGFFFEVLPELAKEEKVRVSILSCDDVPIAWQIDLLEADWMGVHHLAFDEAWKKYSPGKQLLRHNLQRAWSEGREVDFLPGNLDYKEKLSDAIEPVRELHWVRKSIRGRLALWLFGLNIKARRKIRKGGKTTKASETFRKALVEED